MESHDKDPSPRTNLAARRRSDIIIAASRVFDANGYAATTMDAVAAEAKVAKGSLYNYFPSKHSLFVQVFTVALGQDEQANEMLLAEPVTATEKLRRYIDFWYSRLEHYKRVGGLILEFWASAARDEREGELAGIFQQIYNRWHGRISAIIAEGVACGEFRIDVNIPATATSIMAATDGITLYTIMNVGLEFNSDALEVLKRAMLASLTPPQPPREEDQ
ncbi:MAG: TetR/AcrR family transcriptional regulator [Phycisphaerae bacterium]|jgi:AcrR family transcriptional regulator|nr:TetR/AcrR family transcriptional regulator [Phycisphaerae bacterium]